MPPELIPSFLYYCFVTVITPGPANLCSMAAALKYGKPVALRQWRGLFVGFIVVAAISALIAYFIGSILKEYVHVLSYVGAAYITWLAYHIYTSDNKPGTKEVEGCNFLTGFFLQIANVKIIIFCLTVLSSYVLPHTNSFWTIFGIAMILPFIGPTANLVWIFMGVSLQKVFAKYRRVTNMLMALSLLFCAVSILR